MRALVELIISHARLFMIISHVKIIAFQTIIPSGYFILVEKTEVYINRKKYTGAWKYHMMFMLNMIFLNS